MSIVYNFLIAMCIILHILYLFEYNATQKLMLTPYIINAIVCYFNQNVHICMQYQSKSIVIRTRTNHIQSR